MIERPPPPPPQHVIDRLCALASLGGSLASTALGALVDLEIHYRPPRVCSPTDPTPPDRWCTGIVFEAGGDLSGVVAIVLPEDQRDLAVERMLGRTDAPAAQVESALRELGNIIASHTVSAMADALDATILLSVPTLAMREAGVVLGALIAERSAPLRIETDLIRPDGGCAATLVFVPEPHKHSPSRSDPI